MSNVHGMIRSAYKFNPDVVSNETALDTGEDAVTQQCFKDECDINILLAKFAVTGQLPENVRVPQYVDFEEAFDFHSSMNVIRAAEEAFNAMPLYRDWETDRKSTRLNSSHITRSRMPSSA